MKTPETLLDINGYPTEEWLEFIRNFKPTEEFDTMNFVELLKDGWYMADWGYKLHRKYNGMRKLELHTAGWSGNEDVFYAIDNNVYLCAYKMKYVKWRVGGHHYFEIEDK